MKRNKGFTLIEVLIVLFLLTIVLSLTAFIFRTTLITVKKISSPYPKKIQKLELLRLLIENIFFYTPGDSADNNYLFNGNSKEMEFTTILNDKPILVALKKEGSKLVLLYSPLYNCNVDFTNPKLINSYKKIIVLDNIETITISYFFNKEKFSSFKGNIPEAVEIEVERKNGQKQKLFVKVRSNAYSKAKFLQKFKLEW